MDLDTSRDETVSHMVPSRKLGPQGIHFLISNLVHARCRCRVHLVTVRNNWQTVQGMVESCRYLQGTAGVHEVFVRFDRAIDPAAFAVAASRARILVVDDSLVSQKLYGHLLDMMNVQLTYANNGLEAVQRALSDTFDLILMDIEMPELDGLSAVRLLRNRGYLRTIVAISARTDPEDRERCLSAGCDDFLPKPVTRQALAEMVNSNKPEPLVSALLHEPGMTNLIDEFVDGLANSIATLEAAFGSQNLDDLARETRRLKGEAGGIGFEPISNAAAVVEEALKRKVDRSELGGRLSQLIRLCLAARPATNRPDPPREPESNSQGEKPEPPSAKTDNRPSH